MNGVEAELREIKNTLKHLNERLNELVSERESIAITGLSEKSLSKFLSGEPELYTPRDLKVRYK
ncbi:MAG: hypothetical protein ACE5J5_00020 [Candidatus Hydrothermarchaeales archaeon]